MFAHVRVGSARRVTTTRLGAIDAWRFGACLLFAALIAGEAAMIGPHAVAALARAMGLVLAIGGAVLVSMASRWSRRWPIGNRSWFHGDNVRRVLHRV